MDERLLGELTAEVRQLREEVRLFRAEWRQERSELLDRLGQLERWRAWLMGIVAVVSALVSWAVAWAWRR
jgi:hypothetical protein